MINRQSSSVDCMQIYATTAVAADRTQIICNNNCIGGSSKATELADRMQQWPQRWIVYKPYAAVTALADRTQSYGTTVSLVGCT